MKGKGDWVVVENDKPLWEKIRKNGMSSAWKTKYPQPISNPPRFVVLLEILFSGTLE